MDSKKCIVCGRIFQNIRMNWKVKYTKLKWKTAKFCSQDCRYKYQVWKVSNRLWTGLSKHCTVCWKEYKKWSRTMEQFLISKFCSVKCLSQSKLWVSRPDNVEIMNKNRRIFRKEKHWNWKGWITPANHLIRKSKEYDEWRKEVYKRDRYRCTECGSKKDIVAHHIKGFRDFPSLRFTVENWTTLCRVCHGKIHKH